MSTLMRYPPEATTGRANEHPYRIVPILAAPPQQTVAAPVA
jgi:hypothetical protein